MLAYIIGLEKERDELRRLHSGQKQELRDIKDVIKEIATTLDHARVFIGSRQKMHSDGIKLYDKLLNKLKQIDSPI